MHSSSPDSFRSDSDHARIVERARQLWQLDGCPAGRDLDYWLKAETLLRHEKRQTSEQAPLHPATAPDPVPASVLVGASARSGNAGRAPRRAHKR